MRIQKLKKLGKFNTYNINISKLLKKLIINKKYINKSKANKL